MKLEGIMLIEVSQAQKNKYQIPHSYVGLKMLISESWLPEAMESRGKQGKADQWVLSYS
jgi:hypothetical protein